MKEEMEMTAWPVTCVYAHICMKPTIPPDYGWLWWFGLICGLWIIQCDDNALKRKKRQLDWFFCIFVFAPFAFTFCLCHAHWEVCFSPPLPPLPFTFLPFPSLPCPLPPSPSPFLPFPSLPYPPPPPPHFCLFAAFLPCTLSPIIYQITNPIHPIPHTPIHHPIPLPHLHPHSPSHPHPHPHTHIHIHIFTQ